jgi:hypothetical protein
MPDGAIFLSVEQRRAWLVARLEEAGGTLIALRLRGPSTKLAQFYPEIVRDAAEAYGWEAPEARLDAPAAARISRMDECLGWIARLPQAPLRSRLLVGRRMLVHPLTERHLWPWRRLGKVLGVDHHTARRWHSDAIGQLDALLSGFIFCLSTNSPDSPTNRAKIASDV